MTYYFSDEKVCNYLNENATISDFSIQNVPKIALFGIKDIVVNDLGVYEEIHKKKLKEEDCSKGIVRKGLLGRGTHGKVFLSCLNEQCTEKYAFKVIELGSGKDDIQDFWNEVYNQVYFSFTGYAPKIIAAWTCKTKKLIGYIIMEKVEKSGTLTYENTKNLFSKLKKLKIVHNDLHTDNLIPTKEGPKLIDFGLSIIFDSKGNPLPRYKYSFALDVYRENSHRFSSNWDKMLYTAYYYIYNKTLFFNDFKKNDFISYVSKNPSSYADRTYILSNVANELKTN